MSELLQYGLQPKSERKCVSVTIDSPPLMYFIEGLNCLFEKINIVLNQETNSLFYDRDLGSDIPEFIFEDDTQSSIDAIKQSITDSLTRSIENIEIENIDVKRKESMSEAIYDVSVYLNYQKSTYMLKIIISKSKITIGT